MRRAAIIITDDLWVHHWVHNNDGALETREVDASEQLLHDLVWVLAAAEKAAERAREAGEDTAAALLGGCVARVHAALGAP